MLSFEIERGEVEVNQGANTKDNKQKGKVMRPIFDGVLLVYDRNELVHQFMTRDNVKHPREVL